MRIAGARRTADCWRSRRSARRATSRHVRVPVGLRRTRRWRAPSRCALSRATASAAARHVGREHLRARPLVRDRQRDRAGAGAEIEHARVAVRGQARERDLDQRLGLRPRNEHRRRRRRAAVPRIRACRSGRRPARRRGAGARARRRRRPPCARASSSPCAASHARLLAEHVREQHLRVDRHEARLRQRAAHGARRLRHRSLASAANSRTPPAVVVAPAGVLQPGLLQHALRRGVVRMGDADDALQAEVVEAVARRARARLRSRSPAPRLRAAAGSRPRSPRSSGCT